MEVPLAASPAPLADDDGGGRRDGSPEDNDENLTFCARHEGPGRITACHNNLEATFVRTKEWEQAGGMHH